MIEQLRQQFADFIFPEGKERRNSLEREANTDQLTGLANRRLFDSLLLSAEADADVAILVFDADNFGLVNKIKDQVAGDKLLQQIGRCFKYTSQVFGSDAKAFRIGGDEFVVFIKRDFAAAYITMLEEKVGYKTFEGVNPSTGQRLNVTVSISGASGKNYAEACEKLQPAKMANKIIPQVMN